MALRPSYVTGPQLAEWARVSDAVDAALYTSAATAASRAIDGYCNRQFGLADVVGVRTYRRPAAYDPASDRWLVEIDDVQDTAGMLIGGVALALSGAALAPDNAAADGRPYERIAFADPPDGPVVVTARWGWLAVPEQVVMATKIQGLRFVSRRDAAFGVAGSPDVGSELRLLARIDPDVKPTLLGLTRRRRAA